MKKRIVLIFFLVITIAGLVPHVFLNNEKMKVSAIEEFVSSCDDISVNGERSACWDKNIEDILKRFGIAAALEASARLYDRGPEYGQSCHDLMHKIGLHAYELFARGKEIGLNEKTAYCSYGFYHGFMEVLVKRSGSPAKAQDFCAYVGTELGDILPDAKYACFHGIGHGWTEIHDPRYWGDEEAAAASSIKLCEEVADPGDPEQIFRCATGVFDSIALAYYNGLGGFQVRKDDPLWLCEAQPEKYKRPCYMDMMPAVVWMGEYDLTKSAQIVDKFAEKTYAPTAMITLADDMVRYINAQGGHPGEYISVCRKQRNDLVAPCIEGLSGGALQFGIPDREYESGLAFCQDNQLSDSERKVCYAKVIRFSKGRYPKLHLDRICQQIPDEFRDECTHES